MTTTPTFHHPEVPVLQHPWPTGYLFQSPGKQFTYRVIGPCCRLYDREQLPWPCCRIQWRSKEPSWRRIGRRFVVDMGTKRYPSYCVELSMDPRQAGVPMILTLYTTKLTPEEQNWWCTRRLPAGVTRSVPAATSPI